MKRRSIAALAVLFSSVFYTTFSSAGSVEFLPGKDANPALPFSAAVRVGDLYFLSGQIGAKPGAMAVVEGGIGPETRQILDNIDRVLKENGLSKKDVVKCTAMLADIAEWGEFNKYYVQYFSAPFPARSAFGANGLALGARVELECIAAKAQ